MTRAPLRPRQRRPHRRWGVALALLVALSTGCAQTVLFRTDRPGAVLTLDGEEKGPIPEEGLFVSIPPGGKEVDYALTEADAVVERGVIEREVRWLPVVTALLASALFVPFCAFTCFTAANPLSCVAPIWLLAGTAAGVSGVITSPGWLSLPFAFVGTLAGLWPMGLLCFSERTAPVVRVGVTEAGRREREQTDEDGGQPIDQRNGERDDEAAPSAARALERARRSERAAMAF